MDSYTERFSEVHYPLIVVPPVVESPAGEQISAYVSLQGYHRAVAVLTLGAIAATGTVQVRFLQATTTAGASAKGIPTTATQDKITTVLTTVDANSVVVIELRTEELDVDNGFDCVALAYDVDTDTVALSAIVFGTVPSYPPVSAAGYNEIVG